MNEDSVRTIWRMAAAGRDLSPDAEVLIRNLPRDWEYVTKVAPTEVLFGDLHFGNAAFRTPPPEPQAVLFDPIPRRQPWPFEPGLPGGHVRRVGPGARDGRDPQEAGAANLRAR